MAKLISLSNSDPFTLRYSTIRSVLSKEDKEAGRDRYCGISKANALFELGWEENVRSFLGEDEEGKKRKSTLVNQAIKETVSKNRDLFPILNTGLVIVARSAKVDDNKKLAELSGASIINGAQTIGVLKQFFNAKDNQDDQDFPSVSFELIVTDDEDLIGEISIARNFQNRVADLSIYGRQKLFDDLEKALQENDSSIHLRKNETQFDEDKFLDTEKLIQALTALMPKSVDVPSTKVRKLKTAETEYRVYAYRHRARCLKDFARIMDDDIWAKNDGENWTQARTFFLNIAWDGWKLYKKLKGEQFFSSLHKVEGERNGGRKIVSSEGVPDGIVFPMLSALSRFVSFKKNEWKLDIPKNFPWNTLFQNARVLFKDTADHNPNTMGKHAGCYISLHGLFDMFFAMSERNVD
jgi:AIPR protein